LVSVAASLRYFSSMIRHLPSLWLEVKSSRGHLNDFVLWHMSLLAHIRMCKEPGLPCRRIAEGIGSMLNINGGFIQTEIDDPEGRVGAWEHCQASENKPDCRRMSLGAGVVN
jgi:hypothetical protein